MQATLLFSESNDMYNALPIHQNHSNVSRYTLCTRRVEPETGACLAH